MGKRPKMSIVCKKVHCLQDLCPTECTVYPERVNWPNFFKSHVSLNFSNRFLKNSTKNFNCSKWILSMLLRIVTEIIALDDFMITCKANLRSTKTGIWNSLMIGQVTSIFKRTIWRERLGIMSSGCSAWKNRFVCNP